MEISHLFSFCVYKGSKKNRITIPYQVTFSKFRKVVFSAMVISYTDLIIP